MDLADKIIYNNSLNGNNTYQEFGIDELGLPVPYPINTSYIAARILGSGKNIYRVGDDLFIDRKRIRMSSAYIKILCGEPKIIIWSDDCMRDKWKNPLNFIGSNYPIIWDKIMQYAPKYNKRYIEVVNNLIWDRKKSEFILKGEL